MENNSIREIEKFLSENELKNRQGILVFDASVTVYHQEKPVAVFSEVQIISFLKEIALYVLEFVKETYYAPDMYSTRLYHFYHTDKNMLEIRTTDNTTLLTISTLPRMNEHSV